MVICLERDADLHMAQLMPLPLTVSCFGKIQVGFTFLVPAHPGSPGKRAVKRVCVCVCVHQLTPFAPMCARPWVEYSTNRAPKARELQRERGPKALSLQLIGEEWRGTPLSAEILSNRMLRGQQQATTLKVTQGHWK